MTLVPKEPTEEMWGGLARDIMMWMDMYEGHLKTPRNLFQHLDNLGRDIPQWLRDELKALDHVPPKGTRAVLIYKAMLADAPPSPGPVGDDGWQDPALAQVAGPGMTVLETATAPARTFQAPFDAATWPVDPANGYFVCTPERRRPAGTPAETRWAHTNVISDGPGSDVRDDYRCADCGATWSVHHEY